MIVLIYKVKNTFVRNKISILTASSIWYIILNLGFDLTIGVKGSVSISYIVSFLYVEV